MNRNFPFPGVSAGEVCRSFGRSYPPCGRGLHCVAPGPGSMPEWAVYRCSKYFYF